MFQQGLGLLAQPINALAEGFNNFINGVGNFFNNLISSLGQWFSDVLSGIVNLASNIGQWFSNLINSIGDWFANLISSIGDWFASVINGISELINSIGNWFAQVFAVIGDILDYLNPFSENFFLRIAFIPSDGFIPNKFDELKEVIDDRLPIIGTLSDVFNTITDVQGIESTKPKIEVELPGKWGGKKVEIINFDVIDPYVPYVKTLIRFLIWIPFIIKIYRRIPNIIY